MTYILMMTVWWTIYDDHSIKRRTRINNANGHFSTLLSAAPTPPNANKCEGAVEIKLRIIYSLEILEIKKR